MSFTSRHFCMIKDYFDKLFIVYSSYGNQLLRLFSYKGKAILSF